MTGTSEPLAHTPGDIRIGDWAHLSNGNIVIVGESRQGTDLVDKFGGAVEGNHAIFRIVDAAGNEVVPETLVSSTVDPNEIWHGVGVVEGGFGVRFNQGGRAQVRLFNNDGTALTPDNLDLGNLTGQEIAAGGGSAGWSPWVLPGPEPAAVIGHVPLRHQTRFASLRCRFSEAQGRIG